MNKSDCHFSAKQDRRERGFPYCWYLITAYNKAGDKIYFPHMIADVDIVYYDKVFESLTTSAAAARTLKERIADYATK